MARAASLADDEHRDDRRVGAQRRCARARRSCWPGARRSRRRRRGRAWSSDRRAARGAASRAARAAPRRPRGACARAASRRAARTSFSQRSMSGLRIGRCTMVTGCPRRPCAYTRSSQLPKCPLRMSTPVGRSQVMRLAPATPRPRTAPCRAARRRSGAGDARAPLPCAPGSASRRAGCAARSAARLVRKRDGQVRHPDASERRTRPAMPPRRPPRPRGSRARAAARRRQPTMARSTRYSMRSRIGDAGAGGAASCGVARRSRGCAAAVESFPATTDMAAVLRKGRPGCNRANAACHRRCRRSVSVALGGFAVLSPAAFAGLLR